MTKKYNVTIDDDLVLKMETFMKKYHMTRSGLIAVSVSQYMDAMEALPSLKLQVDDLRKALDNMTELK